MMFPLRVIVALGVLTGSLIFFALPAVPYETSSPASPPKTTKSAAEPDMEQTKSALVALIRLNGHKCDTLTKWHPMLFLRGYEVSCDLYYSYDVEDKGGRWVVTVK